MKTVKCTICDADVGAKGISTHLSKLHNVKFIDYVKQHMNDFLACGWQWCDNCKIEPARNFPSSNKKWATCSRTCAAKIKSNLYRDRIPWNKGIDMSLEYKQKLSLIRKGRIGTPHTVETKNKLSELAKLRAQQPDYINPMQGKTHTPEAIMKIGKRVGSSLELLGMKILDDAGISYTHQFFISDKGKTYSFDLKIDNLPILIELDGDYWHGGPGVKKHFFDVDRIRINDTNKDLVAQNRGYKVIRIWESELKNNPSVLLEKIK